MSSAAVRVCWAPGSTGALCLGRVEWRHEGGYWRSTCTRCGASGRAACGEAATLDAESSGPSPAGFGFGDQALAVGTDASNVEASVKRENVGRHAMCVGDQPRRLLAPPLISSCSCHHNLQ